MIDLQNPIFTKVATKLREDFPGILVVTAINADVAEFPCVQIEEINNVPIHRDTRIRSQYARVAYAVRIYCNSKYGKVQEARKILAAVDEILEPMNFTRNAFTPSSGLYNNSVFLITASYAAAVDADGTIYRI